MTALIAFIVLAAGMVIALGAGWALRGWSDVKRDGQERAALNEQVEEHARRATRMGSLAYFARKQAEDLVRDFGDEDVPRDPVNDGRVMQARRTIDALREDT